MQNMQIFEYVRGVHANIPADLQPNYPHHHIVLVRIGFDDNHQHQKGTIDFHVCSNDWERGTRYLGTTTHDCSSREELVLAAKGLLFNAGYIRQLLSNPHQESPMSRTQ
jgi:hypothetical protein